MLCSSHQLQMCERDAVTPDESCTAEHQSTTIASHQFTISHQDQYNMMSDYVCKQRIDQQIFNRKSIWRKITHPQSLFKYNFISIEFYFYLNKDWGCVILREIDFLLKICRSIPCLHPSWKVHTWIEICASLNHRKKTKADGSRLIPRKHTETLVLLSVHLQIVSCRG